MLDIHDIKRMLKDNTFRDHSVLFPAPAHEDIITVSEAVSMLPMRKTARVIGKPVLVPTKQKPWFHACQTCKRTLDAPMESVVECSGCGESSGVELRSRVQIRLTEGQNTLLVTIKSPDVELLTTITPKQLHDSHEFDLGVHKDLEEKFEELTIACFLRRKKPKLKEIESLQPV